MTLRKTLLITSLSAALLGLSGFVVADRDHDGGGILSRWLDGFRPGSGVVKFKPYQDECGSCHYAYQPSLLPAGSWQRIMDNLNQHYGENAELSEPDKNGISDYLMKTAKGGVNQRSRLSEDSVGNAAPLPRITATRHFRHEHDELPKRLVKDNPKVRSFSQCDACHSRAAEGSFDEHQVRIPGFGRWDD